MSLSRVIALAFVPVAALTACDYNPVIAGGAQIGATVRFVNATSRSLDVEVGGHVATGNASIPFGGSSACINADPLNPGIVVRATGTTTSLGFAPSLAGGGNYTAVAFDNSGATQFALTSWGFKPTSGNSGLSVFDAIPPTGLTSSFDVYVTAPAAALGTPAFRNLTFGSATPFFETVAGATQVRLTVAGTQNVVVDAGSRTLAAGQSYLLVLATPSSVLATGCP
jgi:hypothetical protein